MPTNNEWGWLINTLLYLSNSLILFLIGKYLFTLTHRKISLSKELVKKDNFAFALMITGYYIALLICLSGAIGDTSSDIRNDLLEMTIFGVSAIILLNTTSWLNERILLRKYKIEREIIKHEIVGTGIIEAANYIASGLIIYGAMVDETVNLFPGQTYGYLLSGLVTLIAFWALGQLLLLLTAFVYNAILPYEVHDEIEKNNTAAAIGYAGAIIAIAILISYGISGDFTGWGDHFLDIAIDVGLGLLLLPIARWITDWVLLPGERLTDEIVNQEHPNKGAAIIEAFAYIGGACLITWCL